MRGAGTRDATGLDSRTRRVVPSAMAASAIGWWPAFTLGVYGVIFFEQHLALWAAATSAFLAVCLTAGRAAWRRPVTYALLLPSFWLLLVWLLPVTAGTGYDWALFWSGLLITLLGMPVLTAFMVRLLLPEAHQLHGRDARLVIVVVLAVMLASYGLGTQHQHMLSCDDFTISGNFAPDNCTVGVDSGESPPAPGRSGPARRPARRPAPSGIRPLALGREPEGPLGLERVAPQQVRQDAEGDLSRPRDTRSCRPRHGGGPCRRRSAPRGRPARGPSARSKRPSAPSIANPSTVERSSCSVPVAAAAPRPAIRSVPVRLVFGACPPGPRADVHVLEAHLLDVVARDLVERPRPRRDPDAAGRGVGAALEHEVAARECRRQLPALDVLPAQGRGVELEPGPRVGAAALGAEAAAEVAVLEREVAEAPVAHAVAPARRRASAAPAPRPAASRRTARRAARTRRCRRRRGRARSRCR